MAIGLGLGLGMMGGQRRPPPQNLLCNAIARKVRVTTSYEGDPEPLTLEPYAVYKRADGVLMLSAVLVEKDKKKKNKFEPNEYEVSKLAGAAATTDTFAPSKHFDPTVPPYADSLICGIETV